MQTAPSHFLPRLLLLTVLAYAGRFEEASAQVRLYPPGNLAVAATDTIRLVIGSGDAARILVVRAASSTTSMSLWVSQLADTLGNVVEPLLADRPDSAAFARQLIGIPVSDAPQPIYLRIPALPQTGTFAGNLIVRTDAGTVSYFLSARRPRPPGPAVLAVEPRAEIVVPVTLGWRGGGGQFKVTLLERSRGSALSGVLARVVEFSSASPTPFDPRAAITFYWDTTATPDLWSLPTGPAAQARSIPAGGQQTLTARFTVFAQGEYKAKLRFSAIGATDDDAQLVSLVIRVRHSIWFAVIVLLIGIAFSLIVTKVLGAAREQIEYRRTLRNIETAFLDGEPPSLAVTSVQSTLSKANDLATGFLLSWTDWLSASLETEKKRLQRLRRVNDLRQQIAKWTFPIVRRRALKRVREVVALLGGPLDDQVLSQADTQLAHLDQWIESGKLKDCYGADLELDVHGLLTVVETHAFPLPEAVQRAEELVSALQQAAPDDLDGLIARERDYARLKMLWERRRDPERLPEIVELSRAGSLDDLFAYVDQLAWDSLGDLDLRVIKSAEPDRVEAYQPIVLQVTPKNEAKGENYLFKHNCRFEWELVLDHDPRVGRSRKIRLTPVTTEPRVVQYAPLIGTLKAKVSVRFKDESRGAGPESITVVKSSMMRLRRSFTRIEVITLVVAGLAAVASGLLMFYVTNPVFGSLKDYLTLFLWALAVDQGKNALQIQQHLSDQQKPTAATP